MLLQGPSLFPIEQGLLCLLKLVELDTSECELVSIRILHTVLQNFIGLVGFTLAYTKSFNFKNKTHQGSIRRGATSRLRS